MSNKKPELSEFCSGPLILFQFPVHHDEQNEILNNDTFSNYMLLTLPFAHYIVLRQRFTWSKRNLLFQHYLSMCYAVIVPCSPIFNWMISTIISEIKDVSGKASGMSSAYRRNYVILCTEKNVAGRRTSFVRSAIYVSGAGRAWAWS
jgi:hypothetical protein